MTRFVPGREMNRRYYREAVAPILRSRFPGLRHAAALLGPGSEVLGFDTERSMDHDWGPRVQLFLAPGDRARYGRRVAQVLRNELPPSFLGQGTRFTPPDPDHVRVRVAPGGGRGTPLVWIGTIRDFFGSYLHVDPFRRLADLDWLLLPSQKLLSLAVGPIYHDDLGLARVRARFRYYPRDVWLHLLAVQWLRIAEEEAFVGRAGDVGDELGARLIAARQVRELMRLTFLLDRRYYPYDKWFGTAFRNMERARPLRPWLARALAARTPASRELALSRSYEALARQQNALHVSPPLPTEVSRFHDRPYRVIHAGEFAKSIRASIRDRRIRGLTRLGSIDQFGDGEELGSHPKQLRALRALLRA